MNLSLEKHLPTLLAFGDIDSFKSLFKQIKNQFSTKNYKDSQNQIEFFETNENNLLKINTKYYDIDLKVEFVSSIENLESFTSHDQNLEAIFIFLNKNIIESQNIFRNESFKCLIEKSKNKLNIFLSDCDLEDNIKEEFFNKFQDSFVYLKIDKDKDFTNEQNHDVKEKSQQNDNNDDYNDLDELINIIFVHSWSKMKVKDSSNKINTQLTENKNKDSCSTQTKKDLLTIGSEDNNVLDDLDFENLIINLSDIKKKAQNLSFEERKTYAENVVMNFWKSIGGNDDEIADLDDSD